MWICSGQDYAAEAHGSNSMSSKHQHIILKSCLKRTTPDQRQDSGGIGSDGSSTAGMTISTEGQQQRARPRGGTFKSVQFNKVHIRQYERIVGDNPSCSNGAPISIGWGHSATRVMGLDDYESRKVIRRNQMQLILTRAERQRLLLSWGASGVEVVDSIRSNIRVKNQRRRTVNNLGTYDKIEETLENVSRKLKYVLLLQTPVSTVAKKLQVESERVSRQSPSYSGDQSSPLDIRSELNVISTSQIGDDVTNKKEFLDNIVVATTDEQTHPSPPYSKVCEVVHIDMTADASADRAMGALSESSGDCKDADGDALLNHYPSKDVRLVGEDGAAFNPRVVSLSYQNEGDIQKEKYGANPASEKQYQQRHHHREHDQHHDRQQEDDQQQLQPTFLSNVRYSQQQSSEPYSQSKRHMRSMPVYPPATTNAPALEDYDRANDVDIRRKMSPVSDYYFTNDAGSMHSSPHHREYAHPQEAVGESIIIEGRRCSGRSDGSGRSLGHLSVHSDDQRSYHSGGSVVISEDNCVPLSNRFVVGAGGGRRAFQPPPRSNDIVQSWL